jgi:hypothetical protein
LLDIEKEMGVKGEEYDKLSARLIPLLNHLERHRLSEVEEDK